MTRQLSNISYRPLSQEIRLKILQHVGLKNNKEFLSTIALSTRKKVESFERAKPVSSIYMRNPNVTTPSRETRTHSRKKQFTLNIDISNTFEEKLNKFYEFLYIINLSNRIYRGLEIEIEKPLKFFIDKGNNANLIRNIMARRFWWE